MCYFQHETASATWQRQPHRQTQQGSTEAPEGAAASCPVAWTHIAKAGATSDFQAEASPAPQDQAWDKEAQQEQVAGHRTARMQLPQQLHKWQPLQTLLQH